jgi:hypothetical protein
VLFYHLNRRLFPQIIAALKPGGVILCKLRLRCDSKTSLASQADPLLGRNELLSLLPQFDVINYGQRFVNENRAVAEYVGRKPGNGSF